MLILLTTIPAITVLASSLEGTVTADILNVRSEPSTSTEIVTKLKEGDKVVVKESIDEWYKIVAQSKEGYVHQQYIKLAAKASTPSKTFETSIFVNGKNLELEFEPPREKVLGGERLLVPFRAIGETLGIEVSWSPAEKKVFASDSSQNKHVVFTIDDSNTIVDNEIVKLDAPPKLANCPECRTMLPLRFFAETFGAVVNWDPATKTASVNRVIKAEIVEEVKSITPIQLEGMTAKVTVNSLNVRSGPVASADLVSKLSKDQAVSVIDFEAEWLKVRHEGIIGYVHSGYVELFDGYQQKVKGLVNPSSEIIGDRQIVTWSKIAGSNITTNLVGDTLTITSDAKLIERMNLKNEAIKEISYLGNDTGTQISFVLNEGYTAVVYDGFYEVTIALMKKDAKGKRIVIDAGHGANDPGATANGLQEKEIILDVSLRLQKILEAAGVEVLMTRIDDTFIELADRSRFANDNMADAFVSIHANATASVDANGTETFWNANYSGQQSKKLADDIQKQLLAKLGTYDRRVKEANFHVIRNTKMPSVLVELGFLTNKKEAERLATDQFRQKSAEAIFEGINEYFK